MGLSLTVEQAAWAQMSAHRRLYRPPMAWKVPQPYALRRVARVRP
jgi:hypothetical protein